MIPIFDAHLDLAWNALGYDRDLTRPAKDLRSREAALAPDKKPSIDTPTWEGRWGYATVSLPEMKRAGVRLCLATLLTRAGPDNPAPQAPPPRWTLDSSHPWIAEAQALGQLAYYHRLASAGLIELVRTSEQLKSAWHGERIGCILSMEGCDPIVDPDDVPKWWQRGLRTACLAHYERGRYATGTGAAGPLSEIGVRLIKAFERCEMILDLVHTAEPGFWQAMEQFSGPVFVSHGNCRSLVPGDRQLSDEQLRCIINRGGVIGIAMDAWMLLPGYVYGRTPREAVGLEHVADHIDHICQLAGNHNHVGLGTDLDGGFGAEQSPHQIDTIADLQKLAPIVAARGYSNTAIEAIFHQNWMTFFTAHLPRAGP
jgi:membrane dipeptidase